MEIWVDPQCSKCATAVSALRAQHVDHTVRHYLDEPPTPAELAAVLTRLGLEPWDITRFAEPRAAALGIGRWPRDETTRPRWIDALAANPVLIQRPIVVTGDTTAVLARSPEAVRAVLRRAADDAPR